MKKKSSFLFRSLFLLALLPSTACVTIGSDPPEYGFDRAHELIADGRYNRAVGELDDLIGGALGAPSDTLLARAYQCRGDCKVALKRFLEARSDYSDACRIAERLDPSHPEGSTITLECTRSRGDTYLHEGAYRIADRIFAVLLAERPPVPFADSVLYRRYICAIKLDTPKPERYTGKIASLGNFDVDGLRRDFLGHALPPLTYDPQPPPVLDLPGLDDAGVLSRSAWGAAAARANIDPMAPITRITVHHTGEVWTSLDRQETVAKIRDHQKYHQNGNGWADLGYHFIIDRSGRIWEGRELRYQGAHAGNSELNRGNIGVSLMGNFEEQRLSNPQMETLDTFLEILCREFSLGPQRILTHRELKATQCPGRHLQDYVNRIRTRSMP